MPSLPPPPQIRPLPPPPAVLQAATPAGWLPNALAQLDAVLLDHAHCEKKAAGHAMALVAQYGDVEGLVEPMVALAQEELRHFREVYRLLVARGISLTRDPGDPYVKSLLRKSRDGPTQRLVDRLLISGLVEARSAERLGLLASGLGAVAPELVPFYAKLAHAEAGHHRLFVRLAGKVAPRAEVKARLAELAGAEAELMLAQPVEPRIH